MLKKEGFAGHVENSTAAFADPSLSRMSLIVPIFTMSKIEKDEIANLSRAVRDDPDVQLDLWQSGIRSFAEETGA